MKDAYYFPHDYHARNDFKMQNLLFKHGAAGWGIYWGLCELLHEENGYLMLTHCEGIAMSMLTKPGILLSVIKDFSLFENDGEKFWSDRVVRNLKAREEKSIAGREAAKRRWVPNANAMPTQCEGNARKERKGKERKEEEKKEKERKEKAETVFDFEKLWEKYPVKDGKKSAMRSFQASVKTESDWEEINTALENYLKDEKVLRGFIKNGSTWFNNWRDWIVPPQAKPNLTAAQVGNLQGLANVMKGIDDDKRIIQTGLPGLIGSVSGN